MTAADLFVAVVDGLTLRGIVLDSDVAGLNQSPVLGLDAVVGRR